MPGHTWWNGLSPPEHSHPGPSQVPGTDNQGGPALGDMWPWCFQGELLGCLALKGRHGWHFLMWSFAWAAMQDQRNLSCMRSSMHSRSKWPASSWHPLRATSLCAAGKTNWRRVSSDSLGLAHLYRTPFFSSKWLCSHLYWLIWGGLLYWTGLSLSFHLSV